MKVLVVSGSPRKNGNSDAAAKAVLDALADLGETAFIRVADYTIQHCMGCLRCQEAPCQCAITDDDFLALYHEWVGADLVVFCDPVYWLNPSGIVKDFIDRSFGVRKRPALSLAGTKVALVTLAGENGFELHNELVTRWLRAHGAAVIAHVDLFTHARDDPVQDSEQLAKLRAFALGLATGWADREAERPWNRRSAVERAAGSRYRKEIQYEDKNAAKHRRIQHLDVVTG